MKVKDTFNKIKNAISDNKGSVMVTVLVAFLFVSVLVTIVLSTVSVNVKMRYIDSKTKDEFYYAEKALNDIYTGIGQDCSTFVGEKYNKVLNEYKGLKDGKVVYKDQEKAYRDFVKEFVSSFNSGFSPADLESKFNKYIVKDTVLKNTSTGAARAVCKLDPAKCRIVYYDSVSRENTINAANLSTDGDKVRTIVIKNVTVLSNTDSQENVGYVSQINTDIVIEIPWIDFFNTNKSGYDFALSANQGIYFEEGSTGNISGNVFGGTINFDSITPSSVTDSSQYGGINITGGNVTIKNADYVISSGDINLIRKATTKHTSKLTVEQTSKKSNQIWFENLECKNLETEDPLKIVHAENDIDDDNLLYKADIAGNLFAAGDLQLNGNYGEVKINGSYYGYNNESDSLHMDAKKGGNGANIKLYTKESKYKNTSDYDAVFGNGKENVPARSSSIIVNGKKNTVNFESLDTLMVMGDAYINHLSKKDEGITVKDGTVYAGQLPESVAIKASQGLLYVPTFFLEKSNPTTYANGEGDPFEVSGKITTDDWFGKRYIDPTINHKTVKVYDSTTNIYYAYCYLNFKNEMITVDGKEMTCKDAYVYEILKGSATGDNPTAASIKEGLLRIINFYDSKVIINDTSDSRIFTRSAVIEHTGSALRFVGNTDKIDVLDDYSVNLYKRYRLMDTYLETLKNKPLSSDVSNVKISSMDMVKDGHEMPFARFFWLTGIRNAVGLNSCQSYDLDGDKLVLVRCTEELDLAEIKDQNNHKVFDGKTNAIVLIDGPTCVSAGKTVTVNGLIASQGKITVKEGATLNVTYDSGVMNRRISKELDILRENHGYHDAKDDVFKTIKVIDGVETEVEISHGMPSENTDARKLLTYYMLKTDSSSFKSGISSNQYELKCRGDNIGKPNFTKAQLETAANMSDPMDSKYITFYRMYQFDETSSDDEMVPKVNTDYTSYIYFDNWKKGQQ